MHRLLPPHQDRFVLASELNRRISPGGRFQPLINRQTAWHRRHPCKFVTSTPTTP